jgi:CDP-2,3-bis-(O-geranylgeranyl)-sn-glycerol synthase
LPTNLAFENPFKKIILKIGFMVFNLFIQSMWFILPAYAANIFPPIVKGTKPLDFRKKFMGHRIFGDGKTFEGSFAGIVFGVFVGSIQILLFGYFQSIVSFPLIAHTLELVFVLSFGAIFGDIVGAFVKRRYGLARGSPAPLLDQLDFLAVALLLSSPFVEITKEMLVLLLIITPIFHKTTNIIGYHIKVKKTPW